MSSKTNCIVDNYCPSMERVLHEEANARKAGLSTVLVGTINGKLETIGICAKKTGRDRGVMLHYCPFCGQNIEWWIQ